MCEKSWKSKRSVFRGGGTGAFSTSSRWPVSLYVLMRYWVCLGCKLPQREQVWFGSVVRIGIPLGSRMFLEEGVETTYRNIREDPKKGPEEAYRDTTLETWHFGLSEAREWSLLRVYWKPKLVPRTTRAVARLET